MRASIFWILVALALLLALTAVAKPGDTIAIVRGSALQALNGMDLKSNQISPILLL